MRIRLITQNPFLAGFGGVEEQARRYIRHIREAHPDVDIDFLRWDETETDILHIIGIHGALNPYVIDSLHARGHKVVVSPVFYLRPLWWGDFRRSSVYRLCSYIPHHITHWMRSLVRSADLLLPNSLDEGNQLQSVFGADMSKIHVLPNGIDPCHFDGVDPEAFRVHYGLDRYILSVSHIEPRKNHLRLIEAFLSLEIPQKLVLIGAFRGNYFDYHARIRDLIEKYPDRILHIPGLPSGDPLMRSAYLGADLHALASVLETPGIVNLEAGLARCPLVVGDCPPVREYLGATAVYVDPLNTSSIAEGLRAGLSLKNNTVLLTQQSEHIQDTYSWHTIAENLYLHYSRLHG